MRPGADQPDAPTVAFVLEGGGSLGAAQVGMVRALLEAGIAPDLIVGTSVGALNGAMLASSTDRLCVVDELHRMWHEIRRRDVLAVRPRVALRALTRRNAGLVSNDGLGRLIDRWLPVDHLEDLALPYAAVATDIVRGEAVVLREGPARAALLASSALPGLYAPVRMDGRVLVDGGVVANFPVDVAAGLGATRIYALPSATSTASQLRSPLGLVQRASDVLVTTASRLALERTGAAVQVSLVPAPITARSMFDFGGSDELVDDGYRVTRRWLDGPVATTPPLERRSSATLRLASG